MLDWSGAGFDLSANAAAPLADWAGDLQARARFERKGEGPEAFDCWGVVAHVQRLLGRPVKDYAHAYDARDFDAPEALAGLFRSEAAGWARAVPGDVGDVLALARGVGVTHVAVLCGAGRALHCLEGAGVVVAPLAGRRCVTRFAGFRLVGCARPA